MHQGHCNRAVTIEEYLAYQHLVEHHAQGVDIGAVIHPLAHSLLRRNVVRCAYQETALRQGRKVRHPGNAKVHHLDFAVGLDYQVLGLDVPMDDTLPVDDRQPLSHLLGDVQGTVYC